MNPVLSRLSFELADYRYLFGVPAIVGVLGLLLSLAVGYPIEASLGVAVVVFFVAFLALAWSVVVFLRRFRSWLGKPAMALAYNYPTEKAVARVIRILADRNASYFDAGERLGTGIFASVSNFKGSVLVCRVPFVVLSIGAGRVDLFFDASDRNAATVAEVVKTKLSMG